MQTNLYAHTEAHHPYPAFVSVNRQDDGRVLMTVRERGHNGERMATIELSDEVLDAMSLAFIDVRNVPDEYADRAGVAIQQALDRVRNTVIVDGEPPEKLREAIAQRVADVGKPTGA